MELLVDRYRRVRSLGRGAMGEVWLADDTLLGRSVAIKQLRTDPDAGLGEWGDRMRREARLAAQLNHPNAVAVYDLIIDDEQPYVIMEYVPGDSLAQRIRSAGTLAAGEAGYWIGQVAAALEAAHANGILHRDVKPANILITPEGSAKLADFGVARSLRDATHTQTGIMVGTPAYLAPEVAQGGDPLSASDIWSLGATLYAAIEGRPPFGTGADNPLALLARIVSDQVPAAEHAGPLRPIIAAMLSRDPAGRPHAGEVRSWLTEETPTLGERTGPVGPAAEGDADRTQLRQRAPDPQPQPSYPPPGAPFPPQQFAPPMYAPGPGYSYGAPAAAAATPSQIRVARRWRGGCRRHRRSSRRDSGRDLLVEDERERAAGHQHAPVAHHVEFARLPVDLCGVVAVSHVQAEQHHAGIEPRVAPEAARRPRSAGERAVCPAQCDAAGAPGRPGRARIHLAGPDADHQSRDR